MIYITRARRCWRGPSLLQEEYAVLLFLSSCILPLRSLHSCRVEACYEIVTTPPPFAASRNPKARGYCATLQRQQAEERLRHPSYSPCRTVCLDLSALEQHRQLYLSQVLNGCFKSSTRAGQLAWLQEELTWWEKTEE